ncbi:MAG TPA: NAD-dependent epimerase/dehydratase family protein [Acidimicrobiia bacterium]|jgi:nucleoside-diphosphate-sugar epimerase
MDVLVTGSAGFVGRHLVDACLTRGHTVRPCDPRHGHANDGSWMYGAADCRDLFADTRPHDAGPFDLVFHCAAEVGGRVGIDENAAHLGAVNLQLDGALWEWVLRTRPGRVVYFSSAAAYPTCLQDGPDVWPHAKRLSEFHAGGGRTANADETYGAVKLIGELHADRVRKAGVPVTVVRPFSMYDFDQDAEDYPFPAFARRAARHDDPFDVWGDGTQVRDWLHIDDAVAAIFALVESEVDGPVNLCTGVGTSMDELAELAMRAAGFGHGDGVLIRHLTDKPEGVRYRVGNPSLLHRYYTPKISVAEGMRRCVEGLIVAAHATAFAKGAL